MKKILDADDMAALMDADNAIRSGREPGDSQEFHAWCIKFEADFQRAEELLCALDMDEPDAVSEYGGGCGAAYWYDAPGLVIGVDTDGYAWLIPDTQTPPEIKVAQVA